MKKVKVYRVLGGILSVYGIIGYIAYVLKKLLDTGIVPSIISALFMFALNVFLWAGLVLLWQADKNENPEKSSKWLKTIKVYFILSLTIIIAMLALPIIVRIVQ